MRGIRFQFRPEGDCFLHGGSSVSFLFFSFLLFMSLKRGLIVLLQPRAVEVQVNSHLSSRGKHLDNVR